MSRLYSSIMTIFLVLVMIVLGTVAAFIDTEEADDNIMSVGTLDLKTDDADGVSAKWTSSNMSLGEEVPGTVNLKNDGSLDGEVTVSFSADLTETGSPVGVDEGTDAIGDKLVAESVTFDGEVVAELQGKTVRELEALAEPHLLGTLDAAEDKDFHITWKLAEDGDNGLQGDEADLTLQFVLTEPE